jgi:2',3'-cyclic-nucleotide 2'-phosphodiesterase (5'-nucleotidase family)
LTSTSLGLRSGVFKRLRVQNPPALLFDGGDAIAGPGAEHPEPLTDLVLESMALLAYDAIVPGELELGRGRAFLENHPELPWVCANLAPGDGSASPVPEVRWLESQGLRVAVTGCVDPLLYYGLPGIFDGGQPEWLVTDPVDRIGSLVPTLRESGADRVILIAHAEAAEYAERLVAIPGIDVLIFGHAPGGESTFETLEGTPVILPGPGAREIAQLTLETTGDRPPVVRHRIWNLKMETEGDPRIDALVAAYRDSFEAP